MGKLKTIFQPSNFLISQFFRKGNNQFKIITHAVTQRDFVAPDFAAALTLMKDNPALFAVVIYSDGLEYPLAFTRSVTRVDVYVQ
jgi:hypothetical protein